MYIFATFELCIQMELVLTALEMEGIGKPGLMAVPLDQRREPRRLFDTLHSSDGFAMMDSAAILGTCGMLFGSIYGYLLYWGPIIWGIIGALSGIGIGFLLKWIYLKRTGFEKRKITSEVVLLILCPDHKADVVEQLLWDHRAIGVAKLGRGEAAVTANLLGEES
ncbi:MULTISPECIES: hypothetical protein [Paenibacillus]|uniref:hypothetical protein n=1 Tax=Paenibacillus TaxID=44249 RepID=UPI0022B896EC|nr:hypothetical protein [Paenibacillus caseinilyticus]MCZ8521459.1 hypothetical protein [Paenibacillus caseinilyticus]